MSFPTFKSFLSSLLTSGTVSLDKCAVFFNNIESTDGFCGGFVTFTSVDDYPEVFVRNPIDVDGAEITMSGGFGKMTCVYTNGSWSTQVYHKRVNTT
jgi:hypothetical protein